MSAAARMTPKSSRVPSSNVCSPCGDPRARMGGQPQDDERDDAENDGMVGKGKRKHRESLSLIGRHGNARTGERDCSRKPWAPAPGSWRTKRSAVDNGRFQVGGDAATPTAARRGIPRLTLHRDIEAFLICPKVSSPGRPNNGPHASAADPGNELPTGAPDPRGDPSLLQIIIPAAAARARRLAGNLLAMAFFAEGREVQCFATYGGARRGTPVSSFIRVDDRPIRVRCDIEQADALLCFDASLLEGKFLAAARPGTLIVVNSSRSPASSPPSCPATGCCRSTASPSRSATASAASSIPPCWARSRARSNRPALETLTPHHRPTPRPKRRQENSQACVDGYRAIGEQSQRAAA